MWGLSAIKKMNTDEEVRRLAKIAKALNKGRKKSK